MHGFDVGCRVKHFLHSRTSLGAFVVDDHHISCLYLPAQDAVACTFLGVEHLGFSGELQDGLVHAGSLDHAAVTGDVPLQDREPAVFGICVLQVPDAAFAAVGVECVVVILLRSHPDAEPVRRGALVDPGCLGSEVRGVYAVSVYRFAECEAVDPLHRSVHKSSLRKGVHDCHHSASPVHVLYVILLGVGSHLAHARDFP